MSYRPRGVCPEDEIFTLRVSLATVTITAAEVERRSYGQDTGGICSEFDGVRWQPRCDWLWRVVCCQNQPTREAHACVMTRTYARGVSGDLNKPKSCAVRRGRLSPSRNVRPHWLSNLSSSGWCDPRQSRPDQMAPKYMRGERNQRKIVERMESKKTKIREQRPPPLYHVNPVS